MSQKPIAPRPPTKSPCQSLKRLPNIPETETKRHTIKKRSFLRVVTKKVTVTKKKASRLGLAFS